MNSRAKVRPAHARVRENAGGPTVREQGPGGRRFGGAPVEVTAIGHRIDCACADMAVARSLSKQGELVRAALLLRRAQRELVEAELKLLALDRARSLAQVTSRRTA